MGCSYLPERTKQKQKMDECMPVGKTGLLDPEIPAAQPCCRILVPKLLLESKAD